MLDFKNRKSCDSNIACCRLVDLPRLTSELVVLPVDGRYNETVMD
jgi:hypothetical protein